MNLSQGNGRAKPDGFLHLNNFSHVRQSGLAGVLYERLMTVKQQELVELTLLELAGPGSNAHFKHEVWRFKKSFLKDHFIHVVYSVYRSVRKSPAQEISMAISREELQSESRKVIQPSFS
ncbi:hypothetical protein HX794_02565 [Pseudomonas costantinii]|uniref:hypothetical protein n=1 Tax=Pseudomonas costantinii TaxID=168469 RepID=UPI0015A18789|nr:hypothetical protein [Pseudomonas costantinii]NVZ18519.1 hypothetical protein [Pseudomonas costantinii]